jgi:uncharacterized protein (TIGR02271 family)
MTSDDSTSDDMTGRGTTAKTSGLSSDRATARDASARSTQEAVMPVVQEELQVGKRAVERGGVRVIQRVTQTPVKEMIRLREERAVIERRPVDRAATEADLANFRETSVEVREMSEEAVVAKTARVVEEVVVGKDVQERVETVSDNVRRTDVEVEQLGTQRGMSGTTGTGTTVGSGTTGSTGGTTVTGSTSGASDDEGLLEKAGRKIKEGARELKDDLTPGKNS